MVRDKVLLKKAGLEFCKVGIRMISNLYINEMCELVRADRAKGATTVLPTEFELQIGEELNLL